MNEPLHSLSLRANQNQWQCENARLSKAEREISIRHEGSECGAAGDQLSRRSGGSRIYSFKDRERGGRGGASVATNQTSSFKFRHKIKDSLLSRTDGRMDNEWMEGWIGRLAICAEEPTSRRFSDNMGEETMHSSPNRNEDQCAHFHLSSEHLPQMNSSSS